MRAFVGDGKNAMELISSQLFKEAFPTPECEQISDGFNLDNYFTGWKVIRSGSFYIDSVISNAPKGAMNSSFVYQTNFHSDDPGTRIEILISLGAKQQNGLPVDVDTPHIWIRDRGWDHWSEWKQII